MSKFKILASGILTLSFIFFSAPLAFAGGGGVSTTTTKTDDPHWNTIRVYFAPDLFTCKGMRVSFNFETPESGDQISGGNGDNSSTISSEASYETIDGKQYLRCSTYAKVYSSQLKWNRTLNISFKGANLEGSRQIAVSFGYGLNDFTYPLLPWEEGFPSSGELKPTSTPGQPAPTSTQPPKEYSTPKGETRPVYSPSPTKKVESVSNPSITPAPSKSDEQLNIRISSLEAQLAQSQTKQNTLEQKINDLFTFIKHFFPFFR